MYKVIDLFAGAGGLSLGFVQTKQFEIKVAFENSPYIQETYRNNHSNVEVLGDVCAANYEEIKRKYGDIDVVIGGPPCQGFSNANRQKNHAINQNNMLVKEYLRAIKELKPQAFVMENVSMLKSDVHRFYMTNKDNEDVLRYEIPTKCTPLVLLDEQYKFDGALDIIQDPQQTASYLWNENEYNILNVIFRASRNVSKQKKALQKHEEEIKKIAKKYSEVPDAGHITMEAKKAFLALSDYYEGKLAINEIQKQIEPAVMMQRMLNKALEIHGNNIKVESYSSDKNIVANINSFSVFDYLKNTLEKMDDGYVINSGVLCAADFGAPQKRMRFIVVGIKKSISSDITLPKGQFHKDEYRTVRDAIEDLEEVVPVFDLAEEKKGICLPDKAVSSELAKYLRDSKILRNHIITRTTPVAMERFKVLKQGENFHSLAESMKINTFSDASRTQNTVYLRLNYNEPCGTVVNVRKSMWVHPTLNRAVSVREAARLQTFPDSFVFYGTKDKQYQQVGNAVPPIMAKAIAEKLAEVLNENSFKLFKVNER